MQSGVTQAELSTKAGVSRETVSRIERGRAVSRLKAIRVFKILNELNRGKLELHQYVVPAKDRYR